MLIRATKGASSGDIPVGRTRPVPVPCGFSELVQLQGDALSRLVYLAQLLAAFYSHIDVFGVCGEPQESLCAECRPVSVAGQGMYSAV